MLTPLQALRRFIDEWVPGSPTRAALEPIYDRLAEPVPMMLFCPKCGLQHVDTPDQAKGWHNPPHRSHLCAGCGTIWRPADVATTGVERIATRGAADTYAFEDGIGVDLAPSEGEPA